jgi:N-acetylmuramoyl-L-alanine amidase
MKRGARPSPGCGPRILLLSLLLAGSGIPAIPLGLRAQDVLSARSTSGEVTLPLARHRGFPAVPAGSLTPLGFQAVPGADGRHRLGIPGGSVLVFMEDNPFVALDGDLLQMVHPPYRIGSELYLPRPLFEDVLPMRRPGLFRMEGGTFLIQASAVAVQATPSAPAPPPGPAPALRGPTPPPPAAPDHARTAEAPRRRRVVVIDPGHGGDEPGAIGPGGVQEKTIALGVALALAEELKKNPALEVHLTRDRDVAVPLWERGERATALKGDDHAVFLSIHANSVGGRQAARGFETYFLAEARTEDARRVAAIENAPLRPPGSSADADALDPMLNSILNELRLLDHQHWSALLAEFVQQELAGFHPGPNRGVKQGPFAVLTNALMPSVLIELGFISNREEERLMMRRDFQRESARAIAAALERFFQRYPPGQASNGGGSR